MTQIELVRAVLAFYGGDSTRWAQLKYCTGEPPRWCLAGAAMAVHGHPSALAKALSFKLRFLGDKRFRAMQRWNDQPDRTFAEVEQRLRDAEARLAGKDGAG